MIHSQVAFDPTTGEWKVRLGEGHNDWSVGMSLASLERVLRAEYDRRLRDGQQTDFYAQSLSTETILSYGLLNGRTIHRVDPSDPRLVAAKRRQALEEARNMSVDDLLGLCDLQVAGTEYKG